VNEVFGCVRDAKTKTRANHRYLCERRRPSTGARISPKPPSEQQTHDWVEWVAGVVSRYRAAHCQPMATISSLLARCVSPNVLPNRIE